ncbi:MAG: sulfatase-like hydrolase/transferase [Thermoanaerobaculia bacterium]
MKEREREPIQQPPGWRGALLMAVLTAFAISQPIFDLLARHPPFLVAHGVTGDDTLGLVLILAVGLPLMVGLVFLAPARSVSPWARGLFAAGLTLLTACILLPVVTAIVPGSGTLSVTMAFLLSGALTLAWHRWAPVRLFLGLLTPALLVFPLAFLWHPTVRHLIRPLAAPTEQVALPPETKIVILVFDELPVTSLMTPERRIDAELFPNFAALAGHATWFRRASAAYRTTTGAVSAMVTGLYPQPSGQHPDSALVDNLFAWLAGGAHLQVHEEITRLAPPSPPGQDHPAAGAHWPTLVQDLGVVYLHVLAPAPWRRHLPPIDTNWRGFVQPKRSRAQGRQGSQRVRDFRSFVAAIDAREGPQLIFYHTLLPHQPWELLSTTQRYNDPRLITGWVIGQSRWGNNPLDSVTAYQRQLMQTQACDRLLGELVDRLVQLGIYDQSFLVVVADHGVSFQPDSIRRPTDPDLLARDVLPVPMLVKRPGQKEGVIDDRRAQAIDLVPTIADYLGLTVPWQQEGLSLFGSLVHAPRDTALTRVFGIQESDLGQSPQQLEDELLSWRTRHFGSGIDGLRSALDPTGRLIGQRIDSLEVRESEAGSQPLLLLESPTLFEEVDPEGPFVPAHIVGELILPLEAGGSTATSSERPLLAIAVEGVIRAMTWGEPPEEGRSRFSIVAPEPGFRAGFNRIEALRVRLKEGGGYELTSVRTTNSAAVYQDQLGNAIVHLPKGGDRWLDGIDVLQQADIEVRDDTLQIDAHGADPALLLPPLRLPGLRRLVLTVDITAPSETKLRFFYNTDDFPVVHHNKRSLGHLLRAGRNQVFLEVSVENLTGRLRFDPGSAPGEYQLHSLAVYEP